MQVGEVRNPTRGYRYSRSVFYSLCNSMGGGGQLHIPGGRLHGTQKLLLGNLTYYLVKILKIVWLFVFVLGYGV